MAVHVVLGRLRQIVENLPIRSYNLHLEMLPFVDTFPLEVQPQRGQSVSCIESVPRSGSQLSGTYSAYIRTGTIAGTLTTAKQ